MIKRTLGFVATLCVAAGLLQAHHSLAGVYDMKREKEPSATGASVKFTNPHGSLALAVKNQNGSSTEWAMTFGSATALAQRGIGKTEPNLLYRGRDQSEVSAGAGRQSAGLPQDRDHAGRARDPDLRR